MRAHAVRPPGRAALLALAVLLFALALAPASAASAHAVLLGTDPADGAALNEAPATVTLSFNEPVRPIEDGTVLVDGTGTERTLTATTRDDDVIIELPADLGEDRYYVNWRVVSADDHPIAGVLAFTVGDPPAGAAPAPPSEPEDTVPLPLAAATALHYVGLLVFAGLLFFRIVIARGARRGRPRHRLLRAGAAAAITGAALAVPLGALDIAGLPFGRITDTGSWAGLVEPAPLIVLALTAVGVLTAYAAFTRGPRTRVALVAVAAAVAAPVLVGHSMAFGERWLMIAADLVHLATGAIWTGGLAGLLIALRWRASDAAENARIVARFSAWAGYAVAVLGASGLVMALSIHRTWDGLFATDHGRALIVKLALVAVALALAAWNRFRLVPAVADAGARRAGLARLRRILTVEAAVVTAVAVLTGLLVNLSPAVEKPPPAAVLPLGGVTSVHEELGDGGIEAHLTPGLMGENTVMLTLTDAEGLPFQPLEAPTVSAFLPEDDFGPVNAQVHDLELGKYHCVVDLPLAGEWELTVQTRLSEFESVTTTMTVEVG
ncbi:copper resistance CopC/CopD family protein [Glycomyces harbinensis]|uniref:Copper transport protein n=1 Tax=Glycomyces harbinensis TaxID=58114 RepID=A0A1G7AP84_9ACTN|nr:copper resistance protein CopC [Glycomyces harbinensis]SDE15696.1 copper transport protein [Glycomyces harbinensis]